MSQLHWQWQLFRPYPLRRGSEREPQVGGSQAEFNDGELLRPFRPLPTLCPWPGPGTPEATHRELQFLSKAGSHGPLDFVQILNANLASRASSEKETVIFCVASPGKGRSG